MPTLRLVTIFVLVSLVFASDAKAKCAIANYIVTGRVVAGRGASPLSGASILAFANGADDALFHYAEEPAVATAADGGFRAHYRFNTYSSTSLLGSDRCKARVTSVEIVVSHSDPQVRGRRFRFKGSALRIRPGSDSLTFLVDLPVLELRSPVDPRQDDGL